MSTKYRCPENPDHKNFLATAKVTQEWLCDDSGEYVRTVTECVDVLHSPEDLKFVCRECGCDAEEYEELDWSGWSIGDQGTLILMGKDGNLVAQIDEQTKEPGNRIFDAFVSGKERRKANSFNSLPEAIAWCESTDAE